MKKVLKDTDIIIGAWIRFTEADGVTVSEANIVGINNENIEEINVFQKFPTFPECLGPFPIQRSQILEVLSASGGPCSKDVH